MGHGAWGRIIGIHTNLNFLNGLFLPCPIQKIIGRADMTKTPHIRKLIQQFAIKLFT
jgi:hypothetical protein